MPYELASPTKVEVPMAAIETPAILRELAECSAQLAVTSDEYHRARTAFTATRERWQHLRDAAAKAQEAENL